MEGNSQMRLSGIVGVQDEKVPLVRMALYESYLLKRAYCKGGLQALAICMLTARFCVCRERCKYRRGNRLPCIDLVGTLDAILIVNEYWCDS